MRCLGKPDLSAERLRELVAYDEATGLFTRRVSISNRSAVGSPAGYLHRATGYVYATVDGTRHRAHRLAWLYVYGMWPMGVIDHLDGDPANNRIANLRDVTQLQNVRAGKASIGHAGYHFRPDTGKWRALIQVAGRSVHLGYFKTQEEASAAYKAAKETHHGD